MGLSLKIALGLIITSIILTFIAGSVIITAIVTRALT